jgi:hypothetical protein
MIMHPIFGVNALFEHLPTITRLAIKIVSTMNLAQLDNGNRNYNDKQQVGTTTNDDSFYSFKK